MTKDEKIEALKETNQYLLGEITQMAAESMKREIALAKLEAEVLNLRGRYAERCPRCLVSQVMHGKDHCERCAL